MTPEQEGAALRGLGLEVGAGRWTLEMRRVLDTKSAFDVAFSTERPVYISVATYNRTQTRHSEHIRPVRVVLQP